MARATQTPRSNDEWLQALRGEGPDADAAQRELRRLVQRALQKATGGFGVLEAATLEDLTQVAVLRILEKLDRFEGRSRFTTWAYSVGVRAAFGELRKTQYRDVVDERQARQESRVDESVDTVGGVERREIVEVLHRVIESDLTERQRAAIQGELAGTPTERLAQELGTNRNALYKLMHDARVKLRVGLEKAGYSDEEVREAFGLSSERVR